MKKIIALKLRVLALQRLLPKHFNRKHIRWILSLSKDDLDICLKSSRDASKLPSASASFEEFGERKVLGQIVVPDDFDQFTYLDTKLAPQYADAPALFTRRLTDNNFAGGTLALQPGAKFEVSVFEVKKLTTSAHCLEFLRSKEAILVGPYGLALALQLKGVLGKRKLLAQDILSFDEFHIKQHDRHDVPIMTVHKGMRPLFRLSPTSAKREASVLLLCFSLAG